MTRGAAKSCDRLQNRIDALEPRRMLAVTASYAPVSGVLSVVGDSLANTIDVSRNAAGTILVNNGAVVVTGGTPTIANTTLIQMFGQAGADALSLNEASGALPAAQIQGGTENDTITGGSSADQLFGNDGNDVLIGKGGTDLLLGGTGNDALTGGDANDQTFGEAGDDLAIWNPGDDSDVNEGGDDADTVQVNGGNGTEAFTVAPDGTRVRLDRITPAPFTLDIGTTESVVLSANGGDDSVSSVNGLGALVSLVVDGGAGNDTISAGDGNATLLGNDGNDTIDVLDSSSPVTVRTGSETVSATAPFGDSISVNSDFATAGDTPATALLDLNDTVLALTISLQGTLRIGPDAVLAKDNGIGGVFSVGGTIDLAGGSLISRMGGFSQATFRDLIISGRNGGAWNGTSPSGAVNSSLAAGSAARDGVGYGLGLAIAPTNIGGFTIAPGDAVLRYTLDGDANLDKSVNSSDFNLLASNFGLTGRQWTTADFTYDGSANSADFNSLAGNFGGTITGSNESLRGGSTSGPGSNGNRDDDDDDSSPPLV